MGFRLSTRSHTAFTAISKGTPSNSPQMPQSQPQASTPTKIATGFHAAGATGKPGREMVWMTSDTPLITSVMPGVSNCRKPASAKPPATHGRTEVRHEVEHGCRDASNPAA